MRRLLLLAFLLLTAPLMAADVTLQWDRPGGETWTSVRIYERVGAAYNLVAEVTGDLTQATVRNVTPGVHTYVARSVNVWESADSNTASTPAQPTPPGSLRTITVTVVVN